MGRYIDQAVSAPPMPGSVEDLARLDVINSVYENSLPLVKELRENPDYVESNVYGNYSEEDKIGRLTSGPLRGSRGLALQVRLLSPFQPDAVRVMSSKTRHIVNLGDSLGQCDARTAELLQTAGFLNCR